MTLRDTWSATTKLNFNSTKMWIRTPTQSRWWSRCWERMPMMSWCHTLLGGAAQRGSSSPSPCRSLPLGFSAPENSAHTHTHTHTQTHPHAQTHHTHTNAHTRMHAPHTHGCKHTHTSEVTSQGSQIHLLILCLYCDLRQTQRLIARQSILWLMSKVTSQCTVYRYCDLR